METFSIADHLAEIIPIIAQNEVTIITLPTGTGKSLAIPAVIGIGSRITVVVPTRAAALNLTARQQEIQKTNKYRSRGPMKVSAAIGGFLNQESLHFDEKSDIVYATSGYIKKKLLSMLNITTGLSVDFTDVILIDEVHNGTIDNTLIMSILNYLGNKNIQIPRIILASASKIPKDIIPFDEKIIAKYERDILHLNVEIEYSNKSYELFSDALYDDAFLAVVKYHGLKKNKHPFLVFVPGRREALMIEMRLKREYDKEFNVFVAVGNITKEEILKLNDKSKLDKRKIIIASNLAETSLTIKDVVLVVDTMTENIITSTKAGGTRLRTEFISKSSSQQRAGRTGRTQPGTVYRLITKKDFDLLEDNRVSEIHRIPLDKYILEIMSVNLPITDIFFPINPKKIFESIEILKKLGFISHGSITDIGKFGSGLILSPKNSAFIYKWYKNSRNSLFTAVVIACFIDSYGPSYFSFPLKNPDESYIQYSIRLEKHKDKYFSKFLGNSDIESFIKIWNQMSSYHNLITNNAFEDTIAKASYNIRSWSKDNSLSVPQIQLFLQSLIQLKTDLKKMDIDITPKKIIIEEELTLAESLFSDIYNDRILTRKNLGFYESSDGTTYTISNKSVNRIIKLDAKKIIAIEIRKIQRGDVIDIAMTLKDMKSDLIETKEISNTLSVEQLKYIETGLMNIAEVFNFPDINSSTDIFKDFIAYNFRNTQLIDIALSEYLAQKENKKPKVYIKDISGSIVYTSNSKAYRPQAHIGQRKLFLSELQFLSDYQENDIVVYAGAAPGNHIGLLSKYFPNKKFVLFDTNPFNIYIPNGESYILHDKQISKEIIYLNDKPKGSKIDLEKINPLEIGRFVTNSDRKIFLVNSLFTDEISISFKQSKVLFISDIRTSENDSPSDIDILMNLSQQYNWVNHMNPSAYSLKFRYPYFDIDGIDKKLKLEVSGILKTSKNFGIDFLDDYKLKQLTYLTGDINIQPFAPKASTETRLMSRGKATSSYGNILLYENKFFYYNNIERCFIYHENPNADKNLGFDHCADCSLESYIWNNYKEKVDGSIDIKKSVKALSNILGSLKSVKKSLAHGYFFNDTIEKYKNLMNEEISEHIF